MALRQTKGSFLYDPVTAWRGVLELTRLTHSTTGGSGSQAPRPDLNFSPPHPPNTSLFSQQTAHLLDYAPNAARCLAYIVLRD